MTDNTHKPIQPTALHLEKVMLAKQRHANAMTAEAVRATMSPGDYIVELIDIKDAIDQMDQEQLVKAKVKIEVLTALLKKCMPDMKAIELAGANGKPVAVEVTWRTPDAY